MRGSVLRIYLITGHEDMWVSRVRSKIATNRIAGVKPTLRYSGLDSSDAAS